MALLFMDGFDHYATADLTGKWTSSLSAAGQIVVSIASGGGRRGSASFRLSTAGAGGSPAVGISKTLAPNDANGLVGFAFTLSNVASMGSLGIALASLRDGASAQVALRLNPNLTLSVLRGNQGGTVLGTSTVALVVGVMAYIEWKVLIHPSAGTVDVRVNGASVLSLTAQNTRSTANTQWNALTLGPIDLAGGTWAGAAAGMTHDWDDLYVLDGTGAAPWNTFLGDCRVDARLPTGPGATTAWTPSAGANWACVDDAAPNGDTDYTATSTVGATDTFATQDAPVVGATIFGVQHCLHLKKMDTGLCTVAPVIRHAGVDYPGAAIAPGTTYAYGLQIAQANPGTGAQWVEADFNAAEFGYKRTA